MSPFDPKRAPRLGTDPLGVICWPAVAILYYFNFMKTKKREGLSVPLEIPMAVAVSPFMYPSMLTV
jgi:hypothetical protein